MLRHQRRDPLEQLWGGQEIEETTGVDTAGMIKDTLPCRGALVRMHGGWLAGRSVGFGKFQPTTPASQTQAFQSVALT